MAQVVSFQGERVARYLDKALKTFAIDPAHTVYQQGYLMALLDVYREGVGRDAELAPQLLEQVKKTLVA